MLAEKRPTTIEHAVPAWIPNGGPVIAWVKYEYPSSGTTQSVPCCNRYEINAFCHANRDMTAVRVELRSLGGRA